MSFYGIQNTSSLDIITVIEWTGSVEELAVPEGHILYSGSLASASYTENPPTPYTGSFTGSFTGSYFGTASLSGPFTGSFYGYTIASG